MLAIGSVCFSQNVTINITGIRASKGNIMIGVYNNADDFAKEGKQLKIIIVPVTSNAVTANISNLLPGEYAFAMNHDENANGKCDLNLLGIPLEGFAFSNNCKPKLKAPPFRAAKVNVQKDVCLNIKMIYIK